MTYQIKIEKRPNFLHATVTGTNSKQAVIDYWNEIKIACDAHDCFRVLADEKLDGPRFDVMEVFSLISEGSMKMLGQYEAIAYIDRSMGEMANFAETVAVNRGIPIRVFNNVDDAEEWLAGQSPGTDGRDIFWNRVKRGN